MKVAVARMQRDDRGIAGGGFGVRSLRRFVRIEHPCDQCGNLIHLGFIEVALQQVMQIFSNALAAEFVDGFR